MKPVSRTGGRLRPECATLAQETKYSRILIARANCGCQAHKASEPRTLDPGELVASGIASETAFRLREGMADPKLRAALDGQTTRPLARHRAGRGAGRWRGQKQWRHKLFQERSTLHLDNKDDE